MTKPYFALGLLAGLVAACIGGGLLVGGGIGAAEVFNLLAAQSDDAVHRIIVLDIRLPRVLLAGLVGASLGAGGAAIQGLFRNPLADPALIGVSSGAALAAALFIVLGGASGLALAWVQVLGISGSAFLGGLLTTLLVLLVGNRHGGLAAMLLAGIAINAIALAGVGLLTYMANDSQLRSVTFWALGSFNGAAWQSLWMAASLLLAVALLQLDAKRLNAMTLGEEDAEYLGVDLARLRLRVVLLCAWAVGVSVALAGIIAFVGLIVPHLARVTIGSDHRTLIPASALGGAGMLILADALSRTLLAPVELPVGILTAMLGGPFFLALLLSEKNLKVAL